MERVGRPAGVAVMAILQVVVGTAFLLSGIGSLTMALVEEGEITGSLGEAARSSLDGRLTGLLGISFLVLAAAAFIMAYGHLRGRGWSWTLGSAFVAFDALGIMVQPLIGPDPETMMSTAIALPVPVAMAFYLTRFPVRAYFGKVT